MDDNVSIMEEESPLDVVKQRSAYQIAQLDRCLNSEILSVCEFFTVHEGLNESREKTSYLSPLSEVVLSSYCQCTN